MNRIERVAIAECFSDFGHDVEGPADEHDVLFMALAENVSQCIVNVAMGDDLHFALIYLI